VNGRIFDSVSIQPKTHVDPLARVKYIPAAIGDALGYRVEPFDLDNADPAWLLMVPEMDGETPAVRVFARSHLGEVTKGTRVEL